MKKYICAAFFILLILTLTGCGDVATGSGEGFRYHLTEKVSSLDPQTAGNGEESTVITALFEGLCRVDAQGEAVPGVAEEWESNDSHTRYTFHLREDAVWTNGEPVTASDFVFAIERVLSPNTEIPGAEDLFCISGAKEVYEGTAEPETLGVTAKDNLTLVFDLAYPEEDFPKLTAGIRFMPCSEKFFKGSSGRYGLAPEYLLTNGPFEFSGENSWPDDSGINLVCSDTYQGGNNTIPESLTFLSNDAQGNPVEALASGADDIREIDESASLEAEAAGCTLFPSGSDIMGLSFNLNDPVIKNKSLRELFAKTIDREALIPCVADSGCVLSDLIPSGFQIDGSDYRTAVGSGLYPQKDEEITEDIGVILDKLNVDVIPSVTVLCPDDELSVSIVNTVISGWNESIGSYFNILPLSREELTNRIDDGDYQIALYSIPAHCSDIRSVFSAFDSSSYPCLLSSDKFDSMLRDDEESSADYAVMEKYINDSYAFYPVCSRKSYFAAAPGIEGLSCGCGTIDFKRGEKK